jgi:hypothetical protein
VTHFANMHWPGLYSIIVGGTREGGLSRLFIAEPDCLHEDLRDPRRPFLHHAHAYDFRSTTIAGVVENDVYAVDTKGVGEKFHAYSFEPTVDGSPPILRWSTPARLRYRYSETRFPGESYNLDHHAIHRVVFHSCPKTGWFATRIDEGPPMPRPSLCYARELLLELPHRDADLYRPIDREKAQRVLGWLKVGAGLHETWSAA